MKLFDSIYNFFQYILDSLFMREFNDVINFHNRFLPIVGISLMLHEQIEKTEENLKSLIDLDEAFKKLDAAVYDRDIIWLKQVNAEIAILFSKNEYLRKLRKSTVTKSDIPAFLNPCIPHIFFSGALYALRNI